MTRRIRKRGIRGTGHLSQTFLAFGKLSLKTSGHPKTILLNLACAGGSCGLTAPGQVEGSLHRYPNLETKVFETGGHLMTGHSREIDAAVVEFIERHK